MAVTKQPAPAGPAAPQRNPFGFLLVLLAIAFVLYVVSRSQKSTEPQFVGVPLPPLEVAGWFNTLSPTRPEDLRGKFVVLDCWFVGCPPCRAAMPHLVEFNKRFRPQGFQLIGLTIDTGSDVELAKQFVASIPGLDWPIGYGAELPVQHLLGVYEFPTLILFNKSGRSIWAGHDVYELEQAAMGALAQGK